MNNLSLPASKVLSICTRETQGVSHVSLASDGGHTLSSFFPPYVAPELWLMHVVCLPRIPFQVGIYLIITYEDISHSWSSLSRSPRGVRKVQLQSTTSDLSWVHYFLHVSIAWLWLASTSYIESCVTGLVSQVANVGELAIALTTIVKQTEFQ